jgi:hypothetical protein
MEILRSVETHG